MTEELIDDMDVRKWDEYKAIADVVLKGGLGGLRGS